MLQQCPFGSFGQYPNCQVSPSIPLPQQDILPPLQDDVIPQQQPNIFPQLQQDITSIPYVQGDIRLPVQENILPPSQDVIFTQPQQNYPQLQYECPSGTFGNYQNCQQIEAPQSNQIPAADFTEQGGYNYPIPSLSFT